MKFLLMQPSVLCIVTLCKPLTGEDWCDFKDDGIKPIRKETYSEGLAKPTKKFRILRDWIWNATPLNYHIFLFCFPSDLEMFSVLFILSHTHIL